MGKNAKLKEKQKWSEKKLHLENARKLRGIYFIDPEDTEFKETIKNARKKLETSVAPAMLCKIMKNCGSGGSNKIQTKFACIVEELYPAYHIHEQMTTSNYGYDIAYNITHNNIMLEHNAMNNMDTVAHMNVHNTQY